MMAQCITCLLGLASHPSSQVEWIDEADDEP
jgi:hypothetical protein